MVAGVVAWAGIAWIGWTLWQSDPPKAGFDLALLLEGARHVLAGQSPYDPAMLAGASPDAVELFYSYPPPVAQAMTLVSWLPDGVVLVLWAVGATLGFGLVAARLAVNAGRPALPMAVRAIAIAPLVLPFAIAVLFGNLDAWYPLAYRPAAARGAGRVLAADAGRGGRRDRRRVHRQAPPGAAGPVGRGPGLAGPRRAERPRPRRGGRRRARDRRRSACLIGGVQIWLDYVTVVRAGAGAGSSIRATSGRSR